MRWYVAWISVVTLVGLGCGDDPEPACSAPFDCPTGEMCVNGECVPRIDRDAGADTGAADSGQDAGAAMDASEDALADAPADAPALDGGCVEGTVETCEGSSTGACNPGERTCVDGAWSECAGFVGPSDELCNRLDDDCDTVVDEAVVGCGEEENTNERCSDGFDNDFNGFADCADFGCTRTAGVTVCGEASDLLCRDGFDNDGDGFVDCADLDCVGDGVTVCPEATNATCGDGMDNDGDGFFDCADFDCSRNPRVSVCGSEITNTLCSDGMDNDDNGFTDCEDFNCQRPPVTVCE